MSRATVVIWASMDSRPVPFGLVIPMAAACSADYIAAYAGTY
jgi:hypothetical protein